MIYLDNAATTFPKPESVYKSMDKANREYAVNAGRGSYKLARTANNLILETKQYLRELVKADMSAAVVFTPSITIALNQIINGLEMRNGAIVYVSAYEHNAVARTLHKLKLEKQLTIKELPMNETDLSIDLEKLKYEFSKDKPEYVFCTHVSNVTGYILPVKDIFAEAKKYKAITVLDSAQSLGLINVDSSTLGADIIAFAGHKTLYGPIGIGGFVNISMVKLSAYITGGTGSDSLNLEMPIGDEIRFEAASSNIVAISGLNAALKEVNLEVGIVKERTLMKILVEGLKSIRGIKIYLPDEEKHTGILSFVCEGMNSNDIGEILDQDFDIAVRTGYHCAPYIHKYLKDERNVGTVRVGVGRYTSEEDLFKLIEALRELANE